VKISQRDVLHVASLAKLRFSDDELEVFTRQMNTILEYFEKLQTVDTTGIEPSTHAVQVTNVWRDDTPQTSLPQQQALENAPDEQSGYFKVPSIIEV